MKHRSLVPALIALLLVSCDETVEVSVDRQGYVAGFMEPDGRVHATRDKGLYPAMKRAVLTGDFAQLRFFSEDDSWFVLGDGDRIRLLEVDADEEIARVEVLWGFYAGSTCWISLDCVNLD